MKTANVVFSISFFICILLLVENTAAQNNKSFDVCRMYNPICPPGVYIADPEVHQMPDGRIYLYGSRDEPDSIF